MKRSRSTEEITTLAENIVDVASVESQVLTNPAFSMLLAPEAIFDVLKKHPLALINLIRSHPYMREFWTQFANLWPILLQRIITITYPEDRWIRYPIVLYAFHKTLEDWPFLRLADPTYYSPELSEESIEKRFRLYECVAGFSDRPLYFVQYNRVSSLFAKLDNLLSHLRLLFKQHHTSWWDYNISFVPRLNDWWWFNDNKMRRDWYPFSSFCLVQTNDPPESLTHGSKVVLLKLVEDLFLHYKKFTLIPVGDVSDPLHLKKGEGYFHIKMGDKRITLGVSVEIANLFELFVSHLEVMQNYLEEYPTEESETPLTFQLIDETFMEPYKQLVFGYAGAYSTRESQHTLVINELRSLAGSMPPNMIKRRLGSHYRYSLTQCGACSAQNVSMADENLSIAFCDETCLNKYYSEHQIDLSSGFF